MDFKCKTYACDEIITVNNVKELYDDKMEIHYNYINTKSPDDKDRDFLFATKSYSTNGLIFGADSIKIKHITTAFYF